MNKSILILIFLSSLIFSKPYKYHYQDYFNFVYSNLIKKESEWSHFDTNGEILTSWAGAIGIGQITPIALDDFNSFNDMGIFFTWEDIHERPNNKLVSLWYFHSRVRDYHDYDVIKMVNSYVMGIGNTDINRYDVDYLKSIVPYEFYYWMKSRKVIKKKSHIWTIVSK